MASQICLVFGFWPNAKDFLVTVIPLKNGQINPVTNFSSTFGPTESDSERTLGGYLDSRRGNYF